MKYIDADKLYKKIDELMTHYAKSEEDMDAEGYTDFATYYQSKRKMCSEVLNIITSLQQEQPEADLELLKNKAELIANEIMMGVQANKYHTCVYNTASNDFNHSHLVRAALKGIEFGFKASKEG